MNSLFEEERYILYFINLKPKSGILLFSSISKAFKHKSKNVLKGCGV